MAKGKIRSESHLIDQNAILFIRNNLPEEWVIRELSPDYGIDLDVELFENEQRVTLGEHLFFQVKGTKDAKYRRFSRIKDVDIERRQNYLLFNLDVSLLRLVERVGDSLPILLVVIDLERDSGYFVCLNDYVNFVLGPDLNWRKQKTKTIYIPCVNKIENINLLRWYALRPKLNAFFVQSAALSEDLQYVPEAKGYIKKVREFALKNEEADIWICGRLGFRFMDNVYEWLKIICEEKSSPQIDNFLKSFSEDDELMVGRFENLSFDEAKQLLNAQRFVDSIMTANSLFSTCIRQLLIPTEYDSIVSSY